MTKETGIIMSGDHPRKILDGTKTQTRRVAKSKHYTQWQFDNAIPHNQRDSIFINTETGIKSVYLKMVWDEQSSRVGGRLFSPYQVGDILVIKETWATENRYNHLRPSEIPRTAKIYYLADGYDPFEMGIVRSAMFMCYWMSRARPVITGLRAERLKDISWRDCKREGAVTEKMPFSVFEEPWKDAFERLWDSLNAKRGYPWSGNWWIWVISFKEIPC